MIRVLQAGDFHLDSSFSALTPEQAAQSRAEQRVALEALASYAEGCDLVLLTGDLFDSARIYRDSLEALKAFFAAVRCPVFVSPGNHDYLAPGSPYFTEEFGSNVHIFRSGEIERVRLAACDVYGAGFTAPRSPALLEGFRVADPDTINLMTLHGDLTNGSIYDPITPEQVAVSGLDYLALGHIHKRSVAAFGKTTCVQAGCLMGRGFDECGKKGAIRAEVSEHGVTTEFLPLPVRTYEVLTVEAGDDPAASVLAALPEDAGCIRVILTGESDGVDTAQLEERLKSRCYRLTIRDRTTPRRSLWDCAGEDTLRGRALELLKERFDGAQEPEQRRTAALAARLLSDLMDGREVAL